MYFEASEICLKLEKKDCALKLVNQEDFSEFC